MGRRAGRWGRILGAVAVAAASLAVSGSAEPADAQAAIPLTVTVTPAAGLEDGDDVVVNIKTTSEFPATEIVARQCRAGVTYASSAGSRPAADFSTDGPNCPSVPISTSADVEVRFADNVPVLTQRPEGGSFQYSVGTGISTWPGPNGTSNSLSCGTADACVLVVEVRAGPAGKAPTWLPFVTVLDFGAVDPIAGCGGPAPSILTSAGSDRMSDAWVGWTLGQCDATPGVGALSRAVFSEEAAGVSSFSAGLADLVYTGLGYEPEAEFVPDPTIARKAVPIPVGVNAVVLAVAGGRPDANGVKLPYSDLGLRNKEAASLVGGGSTALTTEQRREIETRNKELANGMFDPQAPFAVGAAAERSTVPYQMTRFLHALEADAFRLPKASVFGEFGGQAHGVDSSFAIAEPPYANAIDTFSGRPPLRKAISSLSRVSAGGMWIITDLATAKAFNLTVVKLQNADGEVVAPTDASMLAAVAEMAPNDQGLLQLDPKVVGSGSGVDPYPMTFVEYALAPAEPLVDFECKARTTSQGHLVTWLKHITGDGQADLPAGMLPLTADLKAEAAEAIPEVGASATTGTCANQVRTTSTTSASTATTGAPAPAPIAVSTPIVPNLTSGLSRAATMTGSLPATVIPPGSDDLIELASVDEPELPILPAFAGRGARGWIGVVLALVVIMAMSSAASSATAKSQQGPPGPPPPGPPRP